MVGAHKRTGGLQYFLAPLVFYQAQERSRVEDVGVFRGKAPWPQPFTLGKEQRGAYIRRFLRL